MMKKTFLILMINSSLFSVNAQIKADEYEATLSATTGKKYVNVGGTKLFFPTSDNMFFQGQVNRVVTLDHDEVLNGEIFFYDIPFKLNVPEDNLANKIGSQLLSITPVIVSGYKGKLEKYTRGNLYELELKFGDGSFTAIVGVKYLQENQEREAFFMDFLQSIVYEKKLNLGLEGFEIFQNFTFDPALFDYRFAGIIMGKYAYVPSNEIKNDVNASHVYISEEITGSVDDVRSLELFDLPPGIDQTTMEMESVKFDTINGHKSYEVMARLGKASNQVFIYQTAKTNGDVTIVFTGTAHSDNKKDIEIFKQMNDKLLLKW